MYLTPTVAPNEIFIPSPIAGADERASWRFLEFFTVNVRNPHTRAAYARAAGTFLRCCELRGIIELRNVTPMHVAGYDFSKSAIQSLRS